MKIKTSPRGRNLMHDRSESIKLWAWQLQRDLDADEIEVDEAIKRVNLLMSDAKKLDQHLKAQRRTALKGQATSRNDLQSSQEGV